MIGPLAQIADRPGPSRGLHATDADPSRAARPRTDARDAGSNGGTPHV